MILAVKTDLKEFDKIEANSFAELNIWERTHIEEWIRQAPDLLGEELLVVSTEFNKFVNSNDRLDILAIDRHGNLVVIELKRDAFAGYADLQAIRYAAMVSSMTIDKLLPYYISYQKKFGGEEIISKESARTQIEEFVNDDNFSELSNNPRIILCSQDFSQELTTTVLWLNSNNLDITCVKITPYKIGNQYVIVPNKVIPLQEAKQYLIDVQKKEEEETKVSKSRTRTMRILLENNLIKEGDKIFLKNDLPDYLKYDVNDKRFLATITGKLGRSNAIRWENDENEYAISALTWYIFKDAHPEKKNPGGINGNWHWVTENGEKLWDIAENFLENKS